MKFCPNCGTAVNKEGKCPRCTPPAVKPEKKRNTGLIIVACIAGLLLVICAFLAGMLLTGNDGTNRGWEEPYYGEGSGYGEETDPWEDESTEDADDTNGGWGTTESRNDIDDGGETDPRKDEKKGTTDDEFTHSGSCGANAYWGLDDRTGELVIYGSGEMYDYDYVDNKAPWYELDPSSVTIRGVSYIGAESFRHCQSLLHVVIEDGVQTIGEKAFGSCRNLLSVEIGDSVITIGDDAFMICKKLAEVEMGSNVRKIGAGAFGICNKLKEIRIPKSVEYVGVNQERNISDVYYEGTKEEWDDIAIEGTAFRHATIHYNS